MEDDRAQVDLGIAADIDIEETQDTAPRQPKKRFVGRKQAAEAALRDGNTGDSGAVQGQNSQ